MIAMEIFGEGHMLFATPAFLSVWKSKYLPGLAQVWPVKEVAGACKAGSLDPFYSQKKGIIWSLASAIHPNPSNDSYQRIHSAIALLWCTYWHFNTLKGKLRCSPTADTRIEGFFCGSGMTSDPPHGKYSWASTQRWSVTQLEIDTSLLWNKGWLTVVDLNRITILK